MTPPPPAPPPAPAAPPPPPTAGETGERRILVPRDLHGPFAQATRDRQHTQSTIVWVLVVVAARLVLAGHGDLLPRAGEGPSGRGEDGVKIGWTQAPAEYDRCAHLIRGAGSSVAAVVRSGIRNYLAHDADVLAVGPGSWLEVALGARPPGVDPTP